VFIYHFNRLIHNRVLWIVFAVIVAFAFLSVDSCSSSLTTRERTAGTLGGKRVDAARFAFAERFVGGGRNRPADVPPALVETQTWRHLAALRTAAALGLSSAPEEIRQAIREVPAFSNGGQFDARVYRERVAQALGVTPATYEQMMADQIVLGKLGQSVGTAALVAPMELEDEVAAWTDLFTIQCATFSNRFADAAMELDTETLQRFYNENRGTFALPDRVGVHYATLPVTNFSAGITLHEEEIADYYEGNLSRYTRPSTNDTTVTLTLEEVRSEIVAELTLDEARFAASTNVAAFMASLGLEDFKTFAWRAQARRMEIASTPLFAEDGFVPGIEPEAQEEFRNTAFDLDPLRLDARYAVVSGKEQVYLLMAWTNTPAYTPAFEDVVDQVRPLALAQARDKAFKSACGDARARLAEALAQGQDFDAAAAAQALNVSTGYTFAVQSASRTDFPDAQAVIPVVMRLRKGGLSEPIPVFRGALLAYVVDRQPGDALAAEMVRPQVREALARRREQAVVEDWMQWNLEDVGFTSAQAPVPVAVDDDEKEDFEE
jgi:hypothetical protein